MKAQWAYPFYIYLVKNLTSRTEWLGIYDRKMRLGKTKSLKWVSNDGQIVETLYSYRE